MAACDGFIHGGGTGQGNHDFGGLLPFSLQLAVQGFVRVAVEAQLQPRNPTAIVAKIPFLEKNESPPPT